MKVFKCINGLVKEQNSLMKVLKIHENKRQVISFVGGGGKTSLIYELGNELSKLGKKVIITTTTNMFMPQSNVVFTGKKEDIISFLKYENLVTVGLKASPKDINANTEELEKITGLPLNEARKLIELADFVLVEADGSRRLPLKAPAEHEPVILEGSSLVIGVCGIDAFGKPIEETCHRPNLVANLLNVNRNHIINEKDIALILLSHNGQKKDVQCDYKVIINKVDNEKLLRIAEKISSEFYELGLNELILTTFKEKI
ncbi:MULTISPECIES: selenium cofactor biosynthesis protein YqeC [unclassified Clostridium]|uniref:selenium cofactor biosynthesis protein YqeC n=1 Tax=unclassified Clostridium TaxID=2614128 RepID=UPI000297CB14|nr:MULTISPECIES: selenium cofactor biosynthesis protein YqeC [unclassified Clostridium]EKQ55041.1 MAG: putative selenium-dependent hydroxylase accessory protein YqeC [Clostridium sp. Maddingley MBC34-26]